MKILLFAVLIGISALGPGGLCAQTGGGEPNMSTVPSNVVAIIDGKPYTKSDVERMRKSLPGQFRQQLGNMTNGNFLKVYADLLAVAKKAEADGILEREPHKFQFEFNKLNFLMVAYLNEFNQHLAVTGPEMREYYDAHKADYESIDVSAIYIDYSADPKPGPDGKTPLSENEARKRAQDLREQLANGADFAELAREHSDDATSAAKGGMIGSFSAASNIPDTLKSVILALKDGEVSEPVRDGGRFYLFKATGRSVAPFDEVKVQIQSKVQSEKLKKHLDEIRATVKTEIIDPEFMNENPATADKQPVIDVNMETVKPGAAK